jgi:hypothetical protein
VDVIFHFFSCYPNGIISCNPALIEPDQSFCGRSDEIGVSEFKIIYLTY